MRIYSGIIQLCICTLLLSCAAKKKGATHSDPCMEALHLRKQAKQVTTEERGILEAKAAAFQDLCDKKRVENAKRYDEDQRRYHEQKKKK